LRSMLLEVYRGSCYPLAGLIGTLATFGLAWGIGKLVIAILVMMHPGTQMIQIIETKHWIKLEVKRMLLHVGAFQLDIDSKQTTPGTL